MRRGKEHEEAPCDPLAAFDPKPAALERRVKIGASPQQRGEGLDLGLDRRVRVVGATPLQLEPAICDRDAEAIVVEPKLVRRLEVGCRIPAEIPDQWGVDFWVADVDEVARKTTEFGGHVIQAPTPFPGTVLKSGVIADPEGATLSVTQLVVPG